jgi:hypothetical protein
VAVAAMAAAAMATLVLPCCGFEMRKLKYTLLLAVCSLAGSASAQALGGSSINTGLIESLNFSALNNVTAQSTCFEPVAGCFWTASNFVGALIPNVSVLPFTVDIGTNFTVLMDSRVPTRGLSTASLSTQITSNVDQDVKDKILFDAVPSSSSRGGFSQPVVFNLNNERFISYDMMLATPYDSPLNCCSGTYYVIHLQGFQGSGGNALHPPFNIHVDLTQNNDTLVHLQIGIYNDTDPTTEIEIASFTVTRDTWFHVALDVQPGPVGGPNGKIICWINGTQIVNYSGNWGFAPAEGGASQTIQWDVGVYRRRQPTTQTALTANFKYAYTLGGIN